MFRRGFKSWCENVSAQYRRVLGLRPFDPLNPITLAKHLGVDLWHPENVPGVEEQYLRTLLQVDPDSWSAITICVGSRSLVIVNSTHSKARQASDIMHELAHIILAHKPVRMDVTEDGIMILSTFAALQENEAAWLAGSLLLPRLALIAIARNRTEASTAAANYGVSADMLQYRRNVTGVEQQLRNIRRKSVF
jgi:hypothetical protein